MWMDTKYEPGTVKVVAYDEDGNAVAEKKFAQQASHTDWFLKPTGMLSLLMEKTFRS